MDHIELWNLESRCSSMLWIPTERDAGRYCARNPPNRMGQSSNHPIIHPRYISTLYIHIEYSRYPRFQPVPKTPIPVARRAAGCIDGTPIGGERASFFVYSSHEGIASDLGQWRLRNFITGLTASAAALPNGCPYIRPPAGRWVGACWF